VFLDRWRLFIFRQTIVPSMAGLLTQLHVVRYQSAEFLLALLVDWLQLLQVWKYIYPHHPRYLMRTTRDAQHHHHQSRCPACGTALMVHGGTALNVRIIA
jgi:hypothetical protein